MKLGLDLIFWKVVRTRYVAIIIAIAVVVFTGNGCIHWFSEGKLALAQADLCLYDDPGCSTAVATYATAAVGSIAFIAAWRAARYAVLAFLNERTAHLIIERCRKKRPDIDGKPPMLLAMTRAKNGFETIEIDDATRLNLIPSDVLDVSNVGRAPAFNASIEMRLESPTDAESKVWVKIGTLAASETIHLLLFVSSDFEKYECQWTDGSKQEGSGACEFHPIDTAVKFEVYSFADVLQMANPVSPNLPNVKPMN